MPAFRAEQSKKPQNISPPVSCPRTGCNSLCGLEAKPKREALISEQHNMFNVTTGSAVLLSCRRAKRFPSHHETFADLKRLWQRSPLCSLKHHLCFTMSRKEGGSGQPGGQTTEPRDFSFLRAQARQKHGKG